MSRRAARSGRGRLPTQTNLPPVARPVTRTFVAAIGLSAYLLFTLELLAGRIVLPVFGGSPGVWTTSLFFFTTILFLGYLYTHLLSTRLSVRTGGFVHLTVAAVCVVLTVLSPADVSSLRHDDLPEAINVLYALAVIAGGPAFLLSTTSPLLSAWFTARTGSESWWLYAASNAASFIGLIAYPFILEPTIAISIQRVLVAVGIMAFFATLVVPVVGGRRSTRATAAAAGAAAAAKAAPGPAQPLGVRRQLIWLGAAFVPAGLLSATTSFISTDLVAAPLVWVGPLAIYLVSFVVAFSTVGRRSLRIVEKLVPAAATLLWVPSIAPGGWPIVGLLLVELGAFLVLAIAVHGRLALDRPDGGHLTQFYLILSAGGLLATAFVALIAPVIFPDIWEYPILIVAALAMLGILPGPLGRPSAPGFGRQSIAPLATAAARELAPYAAAGLVIFALVSRDSAEVGMGVLGFLAAGAVVIAIARRPAILAIGTAAMIVGLSVVTSSHPIFQSRTFFSVLRLERSGVVNAEYAGTTLHGLQFLDSRRRDPTSYYVASGPLGDTFIDLRARTTAASIGVVGLGVGTIAAYAQKGDTLTFYEIDPEVIAVARNPLYFTYVLDSEAPPKFVVGDARISLAEAPPASLDILILDAFSSDSVPVHLLTKEAMLTYMRVLRPGGVMVFHLSNRYYDLQTAVDSTAVSAGLAGLALTYSPNVSRQEGIGARASSWSVVGAPSDVVRFRDKGWSATFPGPVLTDDFNDLLRSLKFDSL